MIDDTYTFSLNETKIITRAMQLIGALGAAETPSINDYNICQDFLNALLKQWDSYDLHQWKIIPAQLVLNLNTPKYTLGNNSTDANASETINYTTVNTAISSFGVNQTIVVASNTSMVIGNRIGLVQDDGSIVYGTISNIASTTISTTITTTTTSQVGNSIFFYTTRITKPLNIYDVTRMDTQNNEIPLTSMSSTEYFALTNKTQANSGDPVSYFFQPLLNTAYLYLWPMPSDMNTRITFRYEKQLSDLLIATDTPDIPQEFYLALIYNLAVIIAPLYGRLNELQVIKPQADQMLMIVMTSDQENTSIQFQPNNSPGS